MITPRRTRLVRVPDLQSFRLAILSLCRAGSSDTGEERAVIVPTRASATMLARMFAKTAARGRTMPLLLTRDELYDDLRARLPGPPRRLTTFERDAMFQASAQSAAEGLSLPFQLRPGLVAEMVRFYDQLRRQSQQVGRFETLIFDALGGSDTPDRGAERLLQQTRFLAETFRHYESHLSRADGCDEHTLRDRLISEAAARPLRHAVVSVTDWIADPAGLFLADFDLLARISGLETLDIVSTSATLGSGFHERLHRWWPGLDEVEADEIIGPSSPAHPVLVRPPIDAADQLWFTYRDREEELVAVARRLHGVDPSALDRSAVVFKHPLPYLYLAPNTLGAAGLPFQLFDALPLAAEPVVAVVDLILDAVETDFSREALIALLRSPYLARWTTDATFGRESIAALNRALSDERYLGGLERLEVLAERLRSTAGPAAAAAVSCGRELQPLLDTRPASNHLESLATFLDRHFVQLDSNLALADRERRARVALSDLLAGLRAASLSHYDPEWTPGDLSAALRRWIGEGTFAPHATGSGVSLLDDQAARYGEFDDVTIVGLVEQDWPERPRRNIFYPPSLLKALDWPSEKDRRAAGDARFLDLLGSARARVELSTFTLDDEALVTSSVQLDEIHRAGLSTVTRVAAAPTVGPRDVFAEDALTADPVRTQGLEGDASDWMAMRLNQPPVEAPGFHGAAGPRPAAAWSVSALETYLACPFKFFAQHVLKLDEEPEDDEVMDPRRQGQFVHAVFEAFFAEWQTAGFHEITPSNLDKAEAMFRDLVDRMLESLPESEAALERTRLLGSSAATGLGDAVFRMEAERPVPVVERLLEHSLRGRFTMTTPHGPCGVDLRGKADRMDLLADGTFRLIDYKLGWPPDRSRALQLPIYGVCAEQRLDGHRGRQWTLGEAVYLAFKGPKRVVPLFSNSANRDELLLKAQQRVVDTIDAINRGDFPPSPDDVFRCETCSFQSVCRKDYVGDV